jgi:hypothetical protein
MATHSSLTGADLHEPKGVASAASGEVYVADGAGSGAWQAQQAQTIAYGELFSEPSDSVTEGSIGTTPIKLEGFAQAGLSSGVTVSAVTNDMTIVTSGVYEVLFSISFQIVAAGDAGDYDMHVRVDGVESKLGFQKTIPNASETVSATVHGFLSLTAGEVLTVYVESDEVGGTDDININAAYFNCILLQES